MADIELTEEEKRDLRLCWYDDLYPTHESILLTVQGIVAARVQQAKADAWDEGVHVGWVAASEYDCGALNPYRDAAQ